MFEMDTKVVERAIGKCQSSLCKRLRKDNKERS
jgi:hypothetical protein